jgi:hypothetical protein
VHAVDLPLPLGTAYGSRARAGGDGVVGLMDDRPESVSFDPTDRLEPRGAADPVLSRPDDGSMSAFAESVVTDIGTGICSGNCGGLISCNCCCPFAPVCCDNVLGCFDRSDSAFILDFSCFSSLLLLSWLWSLSSCSCIFSSFDCLLGDDEDDRESPV